MNPALQDSSPAEGRVSDRIPIRRSAICAKRLLSYDNKSAKQRRASKTRFMTIECPRSVHSIVLRMARVNSKVSGRTFYGYNSELCARKKSGRGI